MHKYIEKIQRMEQKPFIIKNFINTEEVKLFQKLYEDLPIEINNKRQKILKKKWSENFNLPLQKKFFKKMENV